MNKKDPNVLMHPGEFGDIPDIPSELPILPLTNILVFPYVVAPIIISDDRRIAVINEALSERKMLGLFVIQTKPSEEDAGDTFKLYNVGTAAFILKMFRYPDGSVGLMVQGLSRIRLETITQVEPVLKGRIRIIPEPIADSIKIKALVREVTETFSRLWPFLLFFPMNWDRQSPT